MAAERGNVPVASWNGPRTSQLTSWMAMKLSIRVEMISFTDRRAHSHAAIPTYRAPPTIPAATATTRWAGNGSESFEAGPGGEHAADEDLALEADVDPSSRERHDPAEGHQDERNGLRQGGGELGPAAEGAVPERACGGLRVAAGQGDDAVGDEEGEARRADGDAEAEQRRSRLATFLAQRDACRSPDGRCRRGRPGTVLTP